METFEIKLEVNGNYESYYSMEPVDSKSELVSRVQLVYTSFEGAVFCVKDQKILIKLQACKKLSTLKAS